MIFKWQILFLGALLLIKKELILKIYAITNPLSYKASKNDFKFVEGIRDRNTTVFEDLQKQKIETLLKFREAKRVIENYRKLLDESIGSNVPAEILTEARKDLEAMKTFKNTLWNKLHEINLALLKEEEKNY